MVICTAITLALYCSRCGKIQAHDISRFQLHSSKRRELSCSCGQKQAMISDACHQQFLLDIFCDLCGRNHVLCIQSRHFGDTELRKLYCAQNNLELGLIGNRRCIEETIENHKHAVVNSVPEQSSDEIVENPQIMLDVLNRVHDIAEKGGVTCRCGSPAIQADIMPHSIELYCLTCGAYQLIPAQGETDLAFMESVERIELPPSRHFRHHH